MNEKGRFRHKRKKEMKKLMKIKNKGRFHLERQRKALRKKIN